MKDEAARLSDPHELIIWERTVKPDTLAYLQVAEADKNNNNRFFSDEKAQLMFSKEVSLYRIVFLLDPLSNYEKDYARTEDEQQQKRINELLEQSLKYMGYRYSRVPVVPLPERAAIIINHIKEDLKKRPFLQ